MIDVLADALRVAHREVLLVAMVGLALGGLDDLLMDLLFLVRKVWRDSTVYVRHTRMTTATLPPSPTPGAIAILIPAWREEAVIGPMLRHALEEWGASRFRIFVGVYPNDPATLDAIIPVAESDARIAVAVNHRDGPTTKADCLNTLWRAMTIYEASEGVRFKAVVLHDAEHVVPVVNWLATQSRVGQDHGQAHQTNKRRFRNEARLPLCPV